MERKKPKKLKKIEKSPKPRMMKPVEAVLRYQAEPKGEPICICRDRPCSCIGVNSSVTDEGPDFFVPTRTDLTEDQMVKALQNKGYSVIKRTSFEPKYPVVGRVTKQEEGRETVQEAVNRIASYKSHPDTRPPIPNHVLVQKELRLRQVNELGYLPLRINTEQPPKIDWEEHLSLWKLFNHGGFLPVDISRIVARSLRADALKESLDRKTRVAKLFLRKTWAKMTGQWD
jgi:hypothetical protein